MKKQILFLLVLLSFTEVRSQYKLDTLACYPAGPGVTYTRTRIESIPLNMDMLTVDLKNPFIKLESVKANEKLDGREVLSSMIKRHTFTGHSVVGGVNADFFDMTTGRPINIQIENGEMLRGPISLSTIGFDQNNTPMLGRVKFGGQLILKDTTVGIAGVNQSRSTDQMILFNSYNGATTGTNIYGTEALVHPLGSWLVNDTVVCIIDTVISGAGNMALSKGSAVLSGHGVMSALLQNRAVKGDTVKIYLGITPGLKKLKEMLGGYPRIVKDGKNWADIGYTEEGGPDHTYLYEPRTGIGFSKDSTKMFLFAADGRNYGISIGVTLPMFADIMLQAGVYQGLNFDGGGSTEMMVRNSIMNIPSDGSERALSNSLLVISTAPVEALSSIVISPRKTLVFRGDKAVFSAVASDKYFNAVVPDPSTISFTCDPRLGTIDNKGNFTAGALNSGSGYIYLNYGNFRDSALVTFKPIVKIILVPKSFTTDTLKTIRVNFKAYDAQNAVRTIPYTDLKWSYSDSAVGYLDINRNFHGKKEGKTVMIADYQGVKDTMEVNVEVGNGTQPLSEMEDSSGWTLSGTGIDLQNTKLSTVNDVKSSGTGALKVDYSFTYNGADENKVFLDPKVPLNVYGIPDSLIIDGRGESSLSHKIYVIFSDDNSELFRAFAGSSLISAGSFQRIAISARPAQILTPGGFFLFPVKITRIEVLLDCKKDSGATYKGTFYLDNLRAQYPLQTTGVEEAAMKSQRAEDYGLMQNYPNPFNPSTIIEFRTKEFSHVSLRVFDILGREVAVLMDKEVPAGNYKVNFNAGGLSSGVYFYKLQRGVSSEIKKMMLVR